MRSTNGYFLTSKGFLFIIYNEHRINNFKINKSKTVEISYLSYLFDQYYINCDIYDNKNMLVM